MNELVQIKSYKEAWDVVSQKPKFYNVVYVGEPEKPFHDFTKEIVKKAASSIVCVFHDIDWPVLNKMAPTPEMVKAVLTWGETKQDIICCCPGGISRSAAIGYSLLCSRYYGCDSALKILDPDKHLPNFLVVQYASEILKKPEMMGYIGRFREQVFSRL